MDENEVVSVADRGDRGWERIGVVSVMLRRGGPNCIPRMIFIKLLSVCLFLCIGLMALRNYVP